MHFCFANIIIWEVACSKRSDGSHSPLHPLAVFHAHFSLHRVHYMNAWNRLASHAHAGVLFACHGTLPNERSWERTLDEALGMSEWEARNRLYQYMGWKNLVSTLNMGSSFYSHSSLLVTPTAIHNATTNLHVPFTVGSQIREPSVVDDTDFQYD